ncbi:MAG: thiolase family protein [Candidatus Dormibacteria bacterium]
MEQAVLVDGVRTPFGRLGGELAELQGYELAALAIQMLLQRVDPTHVGEVILGVGLLSSGTMVPARRALHEAHLSLEIPSIAVDRACCSGMTAIGMAADEIALGRHHLVVAGGMESMSQTPLMLRSPRTGSKVGDQVVEDILLMRSPLADAPIARYTGEVALTYGVDREAQDRWALRSHERYFQAADQGKLSDEIRVHPVGRSGIPMELDEPPRRDTSMEKLSLLRPVYGSPTVTPGNAPGLNDGAAATTVVSETYARTNGLEPLAHIVDHVSMAGKPTSAVYLPAHAIQRLLQRNGIALKELIALEINEAFAAVPAVSLRVLADGDRAILDTLEERTNVNGGAVAIGHPVGASGARITYSAALEARRRGGGYAVAAICGGFGQTDAILLKVG